MLRSNFRYLASIFLLSVSVALATNNDTHYTVEDIIASRCAPGQVCYPSTARVDQLDSDMDGYITRQTDSKYTSENLMYNTNQQRTTDLIAMVKSKEDIQKAVLFAREFNLHVTIKSTGHDFCGRSTWANSFVIHLGLMDQITVNPDPTSRSQHGELKTETGTNWKTIYMLLDGYNRTIVGGSAHTVGPGGYTLGGGHSPISRTHGYAVDNVLEMQVVLADGSIATCTESQTNIDYPNGTSETRADGDLLWALRGGGGGTFGVTVYIVFKLHPQPRQMVTFSGTFPFIFESGVDYGDVLHKVITALSNFIINSPTHWGGYWFLNNQPVSYLHVRMRGSLSFFLNKFAPWDNNEQNELAEFYKLQRDYNLVDLALTNRSSFWDYERNAIDPPSSDSYLVTSLVDSEPAETLLENFIREELLGTWRNGYLGCTGILVGGKTTEPSVDSTPLNPGYRTAVSIMSCGVPYSTQNVADAKQLAYRIRPMGQGMYFNEPSIDSRYWREDFWGKTNYEKLLQIKQRYDADNFFTCYHCVNSDNAPYPTQTNNTGDNTTYSTPTNVTGTSGTRGNLPMHAYLLGLIVTIVLVSTFQSVQQ